ncbi:MAG: SDR family NAD(P)-dependent oxidoreductase [Pseudomonadota bacterium]
MKSFSVRLLIAVLLPLLLVDLSHAADAQRSVLITGATSGIGRNLAEALAREGHHVYAGARTNAEMAELNAMGTLPRFDLTSPNRVRSTPP